MDLVRSKLDENNGVTVFEFRFAYENGAYSEPRQITYYAHSSLADSVAGTSTFACAAAQPDERYFNVAKSYIASSGSTPTFAEADLRLKNPFISIVFAPKYAGKWSWDQLTAPQTIRVLSLRHRFTVDPNRQMVLITRQYESLRVGGHQCNVGVIEDRDSIYVAPTHYKVMRPSSCEADVINKAGTGVCLGTVSGSIKVLNENSNKITQFLQSMSIEWPKGDPMMWQKFFDDRPARGGLVHFSDKCKTEDLACRAAHPRASILPDSGDAFFNNP
jgi:hypothetical protein